MCKPAIMDGSEEEGNGDHVFQSGMLLPLSPSPQPFAVDGAFAVLHISPASHATFLIGIRALG